MRRRPTALAAILGGVAFLLRRRGKARDAERDLWKVATDSPAKPAKD